MRLVALSVAIEEASKIEIYGGLASLRMPLYSYAEASRYLNVRLGW